MTTENEQQIIIVGASAAGLSTAEALRARGHTGKLTLIDPETQPPYDRPPLSKQLLSGTWQVDQVLLRSADLLAELDADFILGERAVHLDLANRAVRTDSGRTVTADSIVIATGVRARHLPGQEGLAGVHVLRTLADAVALKGDMDEGRRMVVIGNGVLGSEIAATSNGLGLQVTLVGSSVLPMQEQLGTLGSEQLAEAHRKAGVILRGGHRVASLNDADGHVSGVVLDTGESLEADIVVVAIGSDPVTDWLTDSGLAIVDGVVCDDHCRAAEGVWAVGDVARWHHRGSGTGIRLENRTNATEQALAVAADILGEGTPYTPIPYFWTDQYGAKIMVHGAISRDSRFDIVDGSPAEGRFVALASDDSGLTGVLGWGMPKQTRLRRFDLVQRLADDLSPVR